MVNNKIKTLTKRQLEVLKARAMGHTYKEIASQLGISKKTVDKHLYDIHIRTGCKSQRDIIHYALHKNLVRNIYST